MLKKHYFNKCLISNNSTNSFKTFKFQKFYADVIIINMQMSTINFKIYFEVSCCATFQYILG